MKLPYRPYQVRLCHGEPYVTLWRPTTRVLIHGPLGAVRLNALVDCGADQTLFPRQFGDALGIVVDENRPGSIKGLGGKPITVFPGDAELEIVGADESYRWSANVRFAPGNTVLLGHLGCLEFFTVTLDHFGKAFELQPNSAFPGVA